MSIFLETKRLVLRAPELSDLDELVTLRSDFEVMRYLPIAVVMHEFFQKLKESTTPYPTAELERVCANIKNF
jgi:RimJ/RimL family protein N-acetyltransferase